MIGNPETNYVGQGGPGFGGGFGGGGFGAFGLVGLIGLLNGRGGLGGTDGGCGDGRVFEAAILSKLGNIEGAIPLASAAITNNILEQSLAFNNTIAQANLAQLQATSNLKDTVQNGFTATLLNDNSNTQQILGAICGLGSKIDQNLIAELQNELAESRHSGRSRETEVNISQTVNQVQAQAQQQQQQQQFANTLNQLCFGLNHLTQIAHATNQNIIAGNAGAVTTGAQTANPTNVNT